MFRGLSSAAAEDKPTVESNRHEFQAETRKLLDIVTNSIYTDKEVFVRELISNASDALEKVRHLQSVGQEIIRPELTPHIQITTNEAENTLIIEDSGVGMSKAELMENLGTIARSGSKAFLEQLDNQQESSATSGIIGKFGVGFYSAFMVADKIDVYSRSALSGDEHHVWSSDGAGTFDVAAVKEDESLLRGTKVVIHLKESCKEFSKKSHIESIVKKYSNFVSFPIELDGNRVNTIEALWTMDAKDVSEEKYAEFYKYVANAYVVMISFAQQHGM